MPPNLQVKLLRVLQDGNIQRLGSSRDISVDVRVIAATHQDLTRLIAAGKFREDLYYRLKVFDLGLPPLRDRADDVSLLVSHFVKNHSEKLGRRTVKIHSIAREALCRYSYPGNVRNLEHIIESATSFRRGRG
jgi:transcriptional regulator with GAF, ATPase, and Fis domain